MDRLETQLQTMSDMGQQLQPKLEDATKTQQQAIRTLSNIKKDQYDTLKAIIQNRK